MYCPFKLLIHSQTSWPQRFQMLIPLGLALFYTFAWHINTFWKYLMIIILTTISLAISTLIIIFITLHIEIDVKQR